MQRAIDCGANCFQIFSSSPRQWKPSQVSVEDAQKMHALRSQYNISPLTIHASYLINLCSQSEEVRIKSTAAFRGEVERALSLGAEFLVFHPGSWKGLTRAEALQHAAENVARAVDGLNFSQSSLRILVENTAGSEFSMGGRLDQVADLVHMLDRSAPVDVCLDTCHTHVAGYDIVTHDGWEQTVALINESFGTSRVKVWHCNDAKAPQGSRLDRHEHVGEGTIGAEPFRRLLRDARFAHCAFIAETPVDEEDDTLRNVSVLRTLASR